MKRLLKTCIETLETRRLLASSYVDPHYGTLGGHGPILPGGSISEVVPLTDGSSLFASAASTGFTLGRLLSDGRTLDSDFNGTGLITIATPSQSSITDLLVLANNDSRVLVNYGGVARVHAFTASGAPDTTFGDAGSVAIAVPGRFVFANGFALTAEGALYVAGVVGNGSTFNSADSLMARVTAAGQIDPAFGGGVQVVNRGTDASFTNYDSFSDVIVLPDGRPVGFGKYHWSFNRAKLGRFSLDGTFDTAWPTVANGGNVDNIGESGEMKTDANGKIFIAVDATTSSGTSLIRMRTTDGGLDTIYGEAGFSYPPRSNLTSEQMSGNFALRPDGSAYIIANYRVSGSPSYSLITAILPSGSADRQFGSLGIYKVIPQEFGGLGALSDIDFFADGSLVVGGRGDAAGSFVDRYILNDTTHVFSSIQGRVFVDSNGNGVKDSDESWMHILVYEDENGNDSRDEFERAILSDSATGEFNLTHLAPGSHRVRLLQLYYYAYTVGSAEGYVFETGSPGVVLSGRDFGVRPQNGITGVIFDDQNMNGIRGGSEPLLAGARVYLDQNRNNAFDSQEPNSVTGADGFFSILDVPVGRTQLGVELPQGYELRTSYLTPIETNFEPNSVIGSGFAAYQPATTSPALLRSFIDLHSGHAPFIDLAFSESVSASITASDLLVRDIGTNAYLSDNFKRVEFIPWGNKTYARLWFEPFLPDGRYELTIVPASIVDFNNNPLIATAPVSFQYLEGDLTYDGIVNFNDILSLAQRFGRTGMNHAQGNVNRDPEGRVDFDDLLIVAQRYGRVLLTSAATGPAVKRSRISLDVLDS